MKWIVLYGMDKKHTIAVAGTGYMGLSIATLLCQYHKVYIVDIVPVNIDVVNQYKSLIQNKYIEKYLAGKDFDLTEMFAVEMVYSATNFVVIAASINYDLTTQHLDRSTVENIIAFVMKYNPNVVMVIKSILMVEYIKSIPKKVGSKNIIFGPEFLREPKKLYDCLYSSRIIWGTDIKDIKKNIGKLFVGFTEAEIVKMIINPYLAFCVAYFNEFDTYVEINGLNTQQIIKDVCLDSRIVDFYNNPNLGYGTYGIIGTIEEKPEISMVLAA